MSRRTERILVAIRQVITQPSKRDLQAKIGPSDLGDPCDKCLARKMAGEKIQRSFSMYPWLGTAIHHLIEHIVHPSRFVLIPDFNELAFEIFGREGVVTEQNVFICHIKGYGDVYGNIDMIVEDEGCIVDWKSTSRKRVRNYKINGVPIENVGQTLLYIKGARASGYNVEAAVLVYIPRDAADVSELWAYEVPYDEDEVQDVITRAENIQLWIDAGRHHELKSDPECYNCNPRGF